MKRFLAIAVIFGAMMAPLHGQDEWGRKALDLSRKGNDASVTVVRFEEALSANDFAAIKGLLVSRISDGFQVDQISREVAWFANGDAKLQSKPGKIIGPLNFRGSSNEPETAVMRTEVEANGEKTIRSYFLEKEKGSWRVILVSPSILDGFFLLTLKGSAGGQIQSPRAGQADTGQPASHPGSASRGKPQPDAEKRSE